MPVQNICTSLQNVNSVTVIIKLVNYYFCLTEEHKMEIEHGKYIITN